MLDLFPATAAVADDTLETGGCRADELAAEFGTPLVVYCEQTIRGAARAYREAAPEGTTIVYGTKAFANVAVMRVLADEGLGADVSTIGELAFARAAGLTGDGLVFHGNNKSDDELRAAAETDALVVLDSPDEPARAAAAGVRHALVRLTPGIDAATHHAIRTAHAESKFGLGPADALRTIGDALTRGIDVLGVHLHIGSQLTRADETLEAVARAAEVCERASTELGWRPRVVDLGGGLGVRTHPADVVPTIAEFVGMLVERFREAWPRDVGLILEPGRSLVGRAGVTLYRVGVVKQSGDVAYVAVDGGMSDNPRPQLYGARYTALLASRAAEPTTKTFRVAGKHCESGDVMIEEVELPEPVRGDLLAVPATGAYTLAMGSRYNGVPQPAVVLVRDGSARLIRRRESVDELLRYEEE
ncbi:MAG TPA: diaminopimelate decarboxylase [Gaiellaceae bacterium]|nr:diaminopimelate decarboxylase [Gaiellaceae bacterium]